MANRLKVTQVRSVIGQRDRFRQVVRGLGLTGPGSVVVVENTPSFRGAIKAVMHLVAVETVG